MIEIVNQKITNADRIRSMTDEELMKVIACPYNSDPIWRSRKECNDCCLDWLRQEAEQEQEIEQGKEVEQEETNGKDV